MSSLNVLGHLIQKKAIQIRDINNGSDGFTLTKQEKKKRIDTLTWELIDLGSWMINDTDKEKE